MKGLNFYVQKPIEPSAPNRMDIACFVGLVDFRDGKLPPEIHKWLFQQGWLDSLDGFTATYHRESAKTLLDVPVPVESWESFQDLFAWDERQLTASGIKGATYLGAAVRSFFAQGGRKCYVVRVGSPVTLNATTIERDQLIAKIIPGFPGVVNASKTDRTSWRGIGHLFGLSDVSYLSMPDLPDLVHSDQSRIATEIPHLPELPEQFVECSEPVAPEPPDNLVATIPAPRTNEAGYTKWRNAIFRVVEFIAQHRREVQLVAGIPLPDSSTHAVNSLLEYMHLKQWLKGSVETETNSSISSTFVQLCYPWLKTAGSRYLPELLEVPEGALAGLLARNALRQGAYRSVTNLLQTDVTDIFPMLRQDQMYAATNIALSDASPDAGLIDRVSLFGFTPDGIKLLSDVTTSNVTNHRPASINRIIALVVRAARRAGEEYVFENNGESLWADIRQRLNELLLTLYNLGALRGKQPEDAFFVRCDRSTMTQNDIDSGRVIAEMHIEPAASIESIDIYLAMNQGGQVTLTALGIGDAVA